MDEMTGAAPWPATMFDLAFFPGYDDRIEELAQLAEPESWDYRDQHSHYAHPVLRNYLQYTYRRLAEQDKLVVSHDGQCLSFNTGLVTANMEPLFAYFEPNRKLEQQPWFFRTWARKGEYQMNRFDALPDLATYYEDPSQLVFDTRKEIRANIEHIVADNKERFPAPFNAMDEYVLQTLVKGALDNAVERVRRNYKTAVPQYHYGRIQLLLPLCISKPKIADVALVADNAGAFYRVSTCLTLDMAYNNARQLATPESDWLIP